MKLFAAQYFLHCSVFIFEVVYHADGIMVCLSLSAWGITDDISIGIANQTVFYHHLPDGTGGQTAQRLLGILRR